jgi:polyisoprenoid-binding protein YceI
VAGMPLATGLWKIDTSHSQLGFSVGHLGISRVYGFFARYTGYATVGPDPQSSSIEVTASTGSINTGNAWRDGHLTGPDFFDSEHFPDMTFRSTAIRGDGAGVRLAGELTIKDITKPISFDLTFNGTAVFPPNGTTHAGFLATTTIRRSEFGAGYGIPVASDEVDIRIDAQLIAPEDATAVSE